MFSGMKWEISQKTYMLIGEYNHTLDDKNRVSLPAKFRKEMGKSVVLAPGFDSCVSIFTMAEWKKFAERLTSESSQLESDRRKLNRVWFGQASQVDVDSLGRILVPETLKDRAGLKSKVVVVGVQDRAEIWNDERWGAYKVQAEGQADMLAETLGKRSI